MNQHTSLPWPYHLLGWFGGLLAFVGPDSIDLAVRVAGAVASLMLGTAALGNMVLHWRRRPKP